MTTASPLSAGEMMISLSMVQCGRLFSSSLDRFGTDATGRHCIRSCLIHFRVLCTILSAVSGTLSSYFSTQINFKLSNFSLSERSVWDVGQ